MDIQRCGHCREEKELSEFAPSYRGRPGTWCRICMRARYVKKPRLVLPEGQQRCTRCKSIKPVEEFYATATSSWCKACYREWHRERYTPKPGATGEPRECKQCGKTYRPKTRKISMYCSRVCKEAERRETGQDREHHLRRKYGITVTDYDRLLAEQGGGCALCGVKPEDLTQGRYRTYLHVDHCHDTGRVRGLLCPEHNLLIGRFGDSPAMFRKIVAYLEAAVST